MLQWLRTGITLIVNGFAARSRAIGYSREGKISRNRGNVIVRARRP